MRAGVNYQCGAGHTQVWVCAVSCHMVCLRPVLSSCTQAASNWRDMIMQSILVKEIKTSMDKIIAFFSEDILHISKKRHSR